MNVVTILCAALASARIVYGGEPFTSCVVGNLNSTIISIVKTTPKRDQTTVSVCLNYHFLNLITNNTLPTNTDNSDHAQRRENVLAGFNDPALVRLRLCMMKEAVPDSQLQCAKKKLTAAMNKTLDPSANESCYDLQ